MLESATAGVLSRDLNKSCFCMTLDRVRLCRTIQGIMGDPEFCREHVVTRPHLYSNVPVTVEDGSGNVLTGRRGIVTDRSLSRTVFKGGVGSGSTKL